MVAARAAVQLPELGSMLVIARAASPNQPREALGLPLTPADGSTGGWILAAFRSFPWRDARLSAARSDGSHYDRASICGNDGAPK